MRRMLKHSNQRQGVPDDLLLIYLREINSIPLLAASDEHGLAALIASDNEEALDHMIRSNLRLVVSIARDYMGKGLSLEDLIEEGNLGLIKAARLFNTSFDTRFATYASYWIKQSILKALIKNGFKKPIRLPAYMEKILVKWRRIERVLSAQLQSSPTPGEIVKSLGLSTSSRRKVEKVRLILQALRVKEMILESPGENQQILNNLTEVRIIEDLDINELLEVILVRVETLLNPEESSIVILRFGLDGRPPMTFKEISEYLGEKTGHVRWINTKAIRKLRVSFATLSRAR